MFFSFIRPVKYVELNNNNIALHIKFSMFCVLKLPLQLLQINIII